MEKLNLTTYCYERGITLIALIITVIVLLILAGVTINLTLGDGGIITEAQNAAIKHREAEIKEKLQLSYFEQSVNQRGEINEAGLVNEILKEIYKNQITEDNIQEFNNYLEEFKIKVVPIKSLEDLKKIGNDEVYSLDEIYVQLNNITFEQGDSLSPIGSKELPFTGVYNGNGYTISGIKLDITGVDAGLVSVNTGVIENLIIKDYDIESEYARLGTIVGSNYGTIKNCTTLSGNLSSSGNSGGSWIGGICGANRSGGVIESCTNKSNVSGVYKLVGGICGYNFGGDIYNCINYGEISGQGSQIGGIAGDGEGLSENDISYIKNCINYGEIFGSKNEVGGIVGCQYKFCVIDTCANTSNVTGRRPTGRRYKWCFMGYIYK